MIRRERREEDKENIHDIVTEGILYDIRLMCGNII